MALLLTPLPGPSIPGALNVGLLQVRAPAPAARAYRHVCYAAAPTTHHTCARTCRGNRELV